MKKKYKIAFLSLLITIIFPLCAEQAQPVWNVAVERFEFSGNNTIEIADKGLAETLPALIQEKLEDDLVRFIYPDEKYERTKYQLKKERISLFLQLSAAVKARDSLVLYDYSDFQFKAKQREQDLKIKEIQKKISENLKQLDLAYEESIKNRNAIEKEGLTKQTQFKKFIYFIKSFFSTNTNLYTQEKIGYSAGSTDYNGEQSVTGLPLFSVPAEIRNKGFESLEFEKYLVEQQVNTLITGKINKVGDYFSINVEARLYPSGRKIASISDVGSTSDLNLIASNISNELTPIICNSIPVNIEIKIKNEDIKTENIQFFVDDVLQTSIPDVMTVESGVHFIQFVCEGYRSAGTNYNFEGNVYYLVEVDFKKAEQKSLDIKLIKPIEGDFLANGNIGEKLDDGRTKIIIDDKPVLGQFISEDGKNAFYYIPQNLLVENSKLSLNTIPFDRGEYVEKRRKLMYISYSALMLSLLPSFYTYGNYYNYAAYYNRGWGNYAEAINWENAFYISAGISIGCGIFFAYELVRYLISAEGVLPKKARKTWNSELMTEQQAFEMKSLNVEVLTEQENQKEINEENMEIEQDLQIKENK